jgi:O-antigen biosynthesis protein
MLIEKTVGKEIKRLIRLSKQTFKIFGFSALLKEIVRYLIHGPMLIVNYEQGISDINNYLEIYSETEIKELLNSFHLTPKISIITPVFNVLPKHLDACIESVIAQHYQNWELCLYDDCSTNEETVGCLERWAGKDSRIKVQFGKINRQISFASNEAIKLTTGEFIGLLDSDDELMATALLEVVKTINKSPTVDFIYSDEDFISPEGSYYRPHFKSDFNRYLLLSYNYISHFAVLSSDLGNKLNWFREGYEGAQDYDLFLRIIEKTDKIIHISKILYHCRQTLTSDSNNSGVKSLANIATKKVLSDYATRNGFIADIVDDPDVCIYRFKRKIITDKKVSIIIPFKDQVHYLKECVESVIEKTHYKNLEILLVSNNSVEKETFHYLNLAIEIDPRIKVLEYNFPFNYSALNNWAVKQSNGEYILLLNNDIKVITDQWLEAMLEHIQQDNVGIVGAKLLYDDNTVQHAGVIVGLGGVAGHSHKFLPDNNLGYYNRASVIQNLSAVTGACLLTKKDLWNKVGGLDEINFKIAFNDIDYCLKIRSLGFEVIYTPYAKLYHYESKSRGVEDTTEKQKRFISECQMMIKRWKTNSIPDPFYNIHLTHIYEDFSLNVRK